MADHRAEEVVAAVRTAVQGLATTGANVDRGRVESIPPAGTPALRVYQGADTIVDPWAQSLLDSEIDVTVEAFVTDSATNVETLLNQVRKEVNIALAADPTLGLAFVHALVELGAQRPLLSGDLTKPAAQMELQYRVKYRRSRTDPSA